MNRAGFFAIGLTLVAACSAPPKTATSVLQDAQKALGDVKTIEFSGTGMNAFVGQALAAGEPWPERELSSFTETINYDQKSAKVDLGFAQPTFGGQQQNTVVNGDKAWNVGPNGPTPQAAAAEQRQLMIWLTPHGFVKAGLAASDAMLSGSEAAPVVSFTTMGKYKMVGTFDSQNLLTTIETKRPDSVLGDAEVVATFSEYKDNAGVKFPSRIAISEGGFPGWELNTTKVTTNGAADLAVPDAVASATVPPVQVASTKIAEGSGMSPAAHITASSWSSRTISPLSRLHSATSVHSPSSPRRRNSSRTSRLNTCLQRITTSTTRVGCARTPLKGPPSSPLSQTSAISRRR
jgi:hypothetical protein